MANDRMYIRCKGCGDLHFLAKCYDDGYFTTHEGEELRQGLDDFFDRHKWCYRDKYYGGFELVYESDDWLEKQKEQKPVEPSDDELQRHQDELYDFKVFAAKQAKEHHISFVHDFEWNNFCAELLSYFNEQKPADLSEMMVHKEPYLAPVPIPMVADEQKQEWSEEDEEMLEYIIGDVNDAKQLYTTQEAKDMADKEIAWLKSLRPSWKPTEEDIMMLERIIEQYETGNKNSKVMGYLPRVEELSFLKKVLSKWKN